ncbi:MAG TPA: hypothetical protein G4N94_11165 [Caldilineae bacterium]|nr:hypothetical protein [Caldilineae bacterium]
MTQIELSNYAFQILRKASAWRGADMGDLLEQAVRGYFAADAPRDMATDEAWNGQRQQIELEQQSFVAQHDALLQAYAGQYIAMFQGSVVDHDMDRVALSLRVRKQYGNQPILITFVRPETLQDIVIRSPRSLPL